MYQRRAPLRPTAGAAHHHGHRRSAERHARQQRRLHHAAQRALPLALRVAQRAAGARAWAATPSLHQALWQCSNFVRLMQGRRGAQPCSRLQGGDPAHGLTSTPCSQLTPICSVTCHTALLDAWKRRSVGARRVHHRQRPRPGWRAPAAAPRRLRPNGASAWQNVLCVFLATFTQHACAASTQHACAAAFAGGAQRRLWCPRQCRSARRQGERCTTGRAHGRPPGRTDAVHAHAHQAPDGRQAPARHARTRWAVRDSARA